MNKSSKIKMNAKTLKALKGSIQHWNRLATGKRKKREGLGCSHCDLCKLYIYNQKDSPTGGDMCVGCPVYEETGLKSCFGSPYHRASLILRDVGYDMDHELFKEAAREELEFLKSLLPKTGRARK